MEQIELKDLRKTREKHFLRKDGLIVAQLFDDDIHYKNGEFYDEIDNTLLKDSEYYHNKSNSYKVYFHENTTGLLTKIDFDNHYICYQLKNSNYVQAMIENNNSKLYKNIKYENILNGIDIKYNVMPTKVKENIIIKNKESLVEKISFNIETDLTLKLNVDKSIYALSNEEIIFKIDAPYLIDINGKVINEVSYKLKKNNDGYLLELIIDKSIFENIELEYPITIDPTITNYTSNNMYDTYIYQGDTNVSRSNLPYLKVGVENVNGTNVINRTLIKFDLPTIGTGSQIVYAGLDLTGYPIVEGSSDESVICVHQITSDWLESGANWNNMNDKYQSRIEASFIGIRSIADIEGTIQHLYHNECEITNLVKKWYTSDPNYGIMLKANKEVYKNGIIPMFFSKNHGIDNVELKPLLTIVYKNQNGVESYMDYKVQSFSQGKTYLNTYNGNLTSIFEVGSTKTGKMPINLNLVYNTNDVILNNDLGYGKGYNLSLGQTIKETTIDSINYLEYLDDDETIHYFRLIDNIYKDEDGLDMTIEKQDSECILKDKDGNKMFFNKDGNIFYLTKIKDTKENMATITYNTNHTISKVIDASSSEINITYQDNKIIIVSPNQTVTLNYINNILTSLAKKSGVTTFNYNDNFLITSITDENDLKICYEYYDYVPYRIKKVIEFATDNSVGNYFNVTYNFNSTTIIDNKNKAETLTFNNYGNVETITSLKNHDDILNAYGKNMQYGNEGYSDGSVYIPIKNKLLNYDIPCKYVKNYLSNSSFEENNILFTKTSNVSLSISNDISVSGFKCLKAISTSINQVISQSIIVPKDNYYTFSTYIKNSSPLKIVLSYIDSNNQEQEKIEFIKSSESFERYDVTTYYPNDATSNLVIKIVLDEAGTYYIDDVQLEQSEVANYYNLLDNSDFSKGISDWSLTVQDNLTGLPISSSNVFSKVDLNNDVTALKIKMDPENSTTVSKTFNINGKAKDTYYISFWYKNEGYPAYDGVGSEVMNSVIITFNYIDDENGQCVLPSKPFNPNEFEWQYFTAKFEAIKDFDSMELCFLQYGEANDLYITNISLFKDVRDVHYEYDESGNLTSINDLTNQSTSFKYDTNNQLINMMNPKGTNFSYEYNKEITDQVLNGISESGISNKIKYDSNNNPIQTKIIKNQTSYEDIPDGYYRIKVKGTNKYVRCTKLGVVLTEYDSKHNNWYILKENGLYKLRHCISENLYLNANLNDIFVSQSYCYINFHLQENHLYLLEIGNSNNYLKVDGSSLVISNLEDNHDNFEFYLESIDNEEFIESNAEYTSDGKVMTSITDSLLHKTLYDIDCESGQVNSITNPNGVITTYSYNDKDQLTSISTKDKTVQYTYNNQQLLDKIIQNNRQYSFIYDKFLNVKQIKLNNIPLVTNNYEENNGNLLSSTYGNNQTISFEYDDFNRLKLKTKSDDTYKYMYDNNGALVKILSNNDIIKYTYDMAKRLCQYRLNDFKIKYTYDANFNVVSKIYELDDIKHVVNYTLNNEDMVTKIALDELEMNYEYDSLQRLKKTTGIISDSYSYVTNGKRTSMLVKKMNNVSYVYNRLNSITHIYNGEVLEHRYYYDDYNELIKENDYVLNQTIVYEYDDLGNILSKKIYNLNTNTLIDENIYEYNNSNWIDQLTKFNNTVITYDEIGNPLTIGNIQLNWINGRQLKEYNDSNLNIEYKYNVDGIRTCKIVNDIETKYYLEGRKIIFEKCGNNVIYYMYDEAGEIIGLQYNNTPYYYIKNNQNDIIAIEDNNHFVLAKYTYDSWGNIISIKDINGVDISNNPNNIANINPFRYRSYYYDVETKLYYLNSRYYNPLWGRFINADGIIGANKDILSYNLYAYVSNDPINKVDSDGEMALTLFTTSILAVAMAVMSVVASKVISNALSEIDLTLPVKKQLTVPDLTKTHSKDDTKVQSKVISKVSAVSNVKENITSKDITKPCTRAKIEGNDVERYGERLTVKKTASVVMSGNSVMCDTEFDVWRVGSKIYGGIYYDGKHKNMSNYYQHYHPNRWSNSKGEHPHIWYYD